MNKPMGMQRKGVGAKVKFEKGKNPFPRLLKILFKDYKWQLLLVVACIVLSSIASAASSVFLQKIIDEGITPALRGGGIEGLMASLFSIVGLLAVIYIIGILASFIYTRIMAVLSQKFLKDIRIQMFNKMQTLPIKYFDTNSHGDIMSHYTNDTDTLRQLIGQSLPSLISSIMMIIVLFGIMLTFSIWLTLLVILSVVVNLIVTKKIAGNSSKYFIKQQKALAEEEGFIEEIIHGQKVVKVFNREEKTTEKFNEINDKLFKDSEKANIFANILMPILGNLGNIFYVIIAFVGAVLIITQVPNLTILGFVADETGKAILTVGIVASFLTMARSFSQTIGQMAQQTNAVVMGLAGAGRIFELIDQQPEVDEGYVTLVNANVDDNGNITESDKRTGVWAWKHPHQADGSVTYTLLHGDIELHEVDFGYVPEKIVLHDVTLYAHQGQKIAFVGSTGAGKTTITNLINRFYDIADGKIRYDGININKIKKADLRRSLGIVLQDTNLFTGTVMENIRYGRLDATDDECIEASKIANAHDFITRLPEGYNTMLTSDGANLSQGQRQLLSIARAACADAPVMILDEATSSIDTRTEAIVQKGTAQLMEGRTVFIIAHRLSTIQSADVIMVLDHGRIIERGSHNELIAKKGQYYQLYTGAFELE